MLLRRAGCRIAIGSALAVIVGCGIGLTTEERFRHPDYGAMERASFELECPKEKLQVRELPGYGQTVGTGCNKKAIYQLAHAGWINTTGMESDGRKAQQ